jgi:hypothetical protein
MAHSLMETAYTCTRTCQNLRPPNGFIYTNVYTKLLPMGQDLYYTRSGHFGYKHELQHLVRLITCYGHATSIFPSLPITGRHAIVTHRDRMHTWGHVPSSVRVIAIEDLEELEELDTTLDWDSIILDDIESIVPSIVSVFPDSRHLSGQVCREMYLIDHVFPRRYKTIYCTKVLSEAKIIDCMFILQTTYESTRFITGSFTQTRSRMLQVAETMFLNAVICV